MGKVTLYHPVSLQVLRGALAYAGFEVGKFTQTRFNDEAHTARYTVPILAWDRGLNNYPLPMIQGSIQSCFASDVIVRRMWVSPSGTLTAELETFTEQTNFYELAEK